MKKKLFKTDKDFGGYWIKNIKNFKGQELETLFQCSVYKDGKRIGFFSEDTNGGNAQLDLKNDNEREVLEQYAHNYLGKEAWAESYHTFISEIASEIDLQKTYKKKCKKTTLVHKPEHEQNQYSQYDIVWNDQSKDKIKRHFADKFPGSIIINEALEKMEA